MPMITCPACDKRTNSALIDHDQDGKCLALWEDGRHVKGCGYDNCDELGKVFADEQINRTNE